MSDQLVPRRPQGDEQVKENLDTGTPHPRRLPDDVIGARKRVPGDTRSGTSGGMTFLRLAVLLFWAAYSWSMGQIPDSGLNDFGKAVSLSFFVAAPLLYFLPTIEGALRNQPNQMSIAMVNIFLGWTLIGWVVAMAWGCKSTAPASVRIDAPHTPHEQPPSERQTPSRAASIDDRIDAIARLANLKDRGALTQEEFDREKERVLREDVSGG